MKFIQHSMAKLKRAQAFTPLLVVGVLIATGAIIYNLKSFAATAGFSFTTSASSYKVGDTFEVKVYEDSDTQCANVVRADIDYPTNLLQYESASASGSLYESPVPDYPQASNGTVTLRQFTTRKACGSGASATSGVSGLQLVSTVTFRVLAEGTATLSFKDSSKAISSRDNRTNVASGRTDKSISLTPASTTTTTPPAPNPAPQTPARPQPKPVTAAKPVNTATSTPLNNNDVIEVTTPTEFNPLPIQPDGINKIEYYLDSKLMATVKTAPYKFKLDTTKLLNGKYKLTTKTYYLNGQTKSVSQTVIVNNPFGWTQFKLRLQKLAWLIVLLLVLVTAAIGAWIMHRRGGGGDGISYDYDQSPTAESTFTEAPIQLAPADPSSSDEKVIHPNQTPRA